MFKMLREFLLYFVFNSNLTKSLKELKESYQNQSEELQDLLIQRDKVQKETAMKEEDALINERDGESSQTAATPSKDRDAKKRPKKEVADLGFEDEALQVEDLEPPGVAAAKVGLRTRTQVHSGYFRPRVRMHVKQKLRVTCKGEFVAFVTAMMRIRMQ